MTDCMTAERARVIAERLEDVFILKFEAGGWEDTTHYSCELNDWTKFEFEAGFRNWHFAVTEPDGRRCDMSLDGKASAEAVSSGIVAAIDAYCFAKGIRIPKWGQVWGSERELAMREAGIEP